MQYEYKTVKLGTVDEQATADDVMNKLGKDGWELVTVTGGSMLGITLWFKREVIKSKQASRVIIQESESFVAANPSATGTIIEAIGQPLTDEDGNTRVTYQRDVEGSES